MPNATVRANARTLSKTPPPKPETGEEFVLSTIAAEKRRQREARAEAADAGSPLPSAEQPTLLDVSDDLGLVRDLVDACYMAAGSLPKGIGRDPLSRLLNLISDKLADARGDLDNILEAAR